MISAPGGWRKTLRIMENSILIRPVAETDAEAILTSLKVTSGM